MASVSAATRLAYAIQGVSADVTETTTIVFGTSAAGTTRGIMDGMITLSANKYTNVNNF